MSWIVVALQVDLPTPLRLQLVVAVVVSVRVLPSWRWCVVCGGGGGGGGGGVCVCCVGEVASQCVLNVPEGGQDAAARALVLLPGASVPISAAAHPTASTGTHAAGGRQRAQPEKMPQMGRL